MDPNGPARERLHMANSIKTPAPSPKRRASLGVPASVVKRSRHAHRGCKKLRVRWLLALAAWRYCFAALEVSCRDQRVAARALPTFLVLFGARSRACCSRLAMNARSAAAVGLRWRAGAAAGSDSRVSILAKRRCARTSLRRPTMR